MVHSYLVSPIGTLTKAPYHVHWCQVLLSRRTKDVGLHPDNFTPSDMNLRADWTSFSYILLQKLDVT